MSLADFAARLSVFVVLIERAAPATRLSLCRQSFGFLYGGCHFVDFNFPIDYGLLQVEVGLFLSYRVKKLEIFWFPLFPRGGSPNVSVRCSVKWLK
jgi:hypothetical protein